MRSLLVGIVRAKCFQNDGGPRTDGILILQAAEDSVKVSYSFPAGVVKPGSYVSLTACYSTASGYDRAWRKPNPMDFTVQSLSSLPQLCRPYAAGCAAHHGLHGRKAFATYTLAMPTLQALWAGFQDACNAVCASACVCGLPSKFPQMPHTW